MKKLFVSMGLVAAGTAGMHAAYAPDVGPMEATKMWNVSATLRGFYDDNYTTSSGTAKRSSLGFEVSPQFGLVMPLQQTEFGLRYIYGLYYYQDREATGENPIDQTHQLNLWVDHAFTEHWQVKMQDTLAVAQEPELLNPNGVYGLPTRVQGNNIANTGTIILHTDWTRLFSTELGYQNTFYDYENSGAEVGLVPTPLFYSPIPGPVIIEPSVDASLAGVLNRIEQSAWLNLQWQLTPETMFQVGARYELVNYTGNELVTLANVYSPTPPHAWSHQVPYHSDNRDNRSYIGYLGFQHAFLPNLIVSAQGGIQYTEVYNDPLGSSPSMSPYSVMSATYTYSAGNYMQVGFQQSQNATDVIAPASTGRITQYQESSVVYASINHHLTPKLLATIIGHWQNAAFQEGAYANDSEVFYDLGVNLNYSFNPHFSADLGYNLDNLKSGVPGREYTRNRFYLGVTAAY